jgi:hypothetical protein
MRVFNTSHNNFFLREYVQSVRSVVVVNKPQIKIFYENMRTKLNVIEFRFKTITNELLGEFATKNVCIFPDLGCDQLFELK